MVISIKKVKFSPTAKFYLEDEGAPVFNPARKIVHFSSRKEAMSVKKHLEGR